MSTSVPLVHEYRGDTLDLIHFGHIAIVDERSQIIYKAGDPYATVFYRSSSKPIQALPTISRGLDKEYGLTDEETAIFAASHSGEDFHVVALESILSKAGFSEEMLIMKPARPSNVKANEERITRGLPKRKLYHNCSGKHAALMLLQRKLGGKTGDYWKLDSPAQLEVIETIKKLSETDHVEIGVDGCGVPVFAVGLKHIAISFKNLVRPGMIRDEALGRAAERFIPRIHRYPLMIVGTGSVCSYLNYDPNILAKGGANGVYGLALKNEGIGVAFKVTDGTESAWPLIIMDILRGLGHLSPETEKRLEGLSPAVILNDNETVVGRRETVFRGF